MKTLLHAGTFICAFNMCVKLTSKFEFKYLIFKLRKKNSKQNKKEKEKSKQPWSETYRPRPISFYSRTGHWCRQAGLVCQLARRLSRASSPANAFGAWWAPSIYPFPAAAFTSWPPVTYRRARDVRPLPFLRSRDPAEFDPDALLGVPLKPPQTDLATAIKGSSEDFASPFHRHRPFSSDARERESQGIGVTAAACSSHHLCCPVAGRGIGEILIRRGSYAGRK
jgi:hypothetical protein